MQVGITHRFGIIMYQKLLGDQVLPGSAVEAACSAHPEPLAVFTGRAVETAWHE